MRIISGLQTVYRTQAPFGKARGNTVPQKLGLAYQKKVAKAIRLLPEIQHVEETPWFGFSDSTGGGLASPDLLVYTNYDAVLCIEVKLSWTPDAVSQLYDFYLPILTRVAQTELLPASRVVPLIITKNLLPNAPRAELNINSALKHNPSLLHWRGEGGIRW